MWTWHWPWRQTARRGMTRLLKCGPTLWAGLISRKGVYQFRHSRFMFQESLRLNEKRGGGRRSDRPLSSGDWLIRK